MRHIREQDVAGERMEARYTRVVNHLAALRTMGTPKIWMDISVIEPQSASIVVTPPGSHLPVQ